MSAACASTRTSSARRWADGRRLQGRGRGAARRIDEETEPAYDLLKVAPNPIAIKAALNLLGHEVGGHRLPLVPATEDEIARVRDCLERVGVPVGLPRPSGAYTSAVTEALVRVIPLGGLGEVGKNMTVFEHGEERSSSMPGSRFRATSISGSTSSSPTSLSARAPRSIRAVVLTHAHEDHVGGLPYLLREVEVPEVWATRLTLGLVKSKLDEHGLLNSAELREIDPEGAPVELGPFRLEFVRMAHSVPDNVGVVIETAAGGSCTRATGSSTTRRSTASARTSDGSPRSATAASTCCSATRRTPNGPGFTGSERLVGEAFRQIIPQRTGRVLVASFASNVHRMQQAIDVAVQTGRKVAIVGRSMRKNLNIAGNLGYLDMPEGTVIQPKALDEYEPHEVLILCTG